MNLLEKYQTGTILKVDMLDIMQMSDFNPRTEMNDKTLNELNNVEFVPPIELGYCAGVAGNKFIIVDGNHRYISRMNRDAEEIDAIVRVYETEAELFKQATLANINHGVRLNKEDRINALAKILSFYNEEDVKIAELSRELKVNERELRKISKWLSLKEVFEEDIFKYNITKADVIYRLYSKGSFTTDEFKTKVGEILHMPFSDLTKMVNLLIEDKNYEVREYVVEETKKEVDALEGDFDEDLDLALDDLDLDFDEDEMDDFIVQESEKFTADLGELDNIQAEFKESGTVIDPENRLLKSFELFSEEIKLLKDFTENKTVSLEEDNKIKVKLKIETLIENLNKIKENL